MNFDNLKCAAGNGISEFYLVPTRIIMKEKTENAEYLLAERPRQASFAPPENSCLIKKDGFIIFDFGKEIQGGAVISVQRADNANIRLVFGESVSEAMSVLGEKNSVNVHAPRDYTIQNDGLSTVTTGNTGFRFLKIQPDKDCYICCVQAALRIRDMDWRGSFHTSDAMADKIWETAAYTVQLNMQEYIWDGIKRDRLVWAGDMNPSIATALCVFGDTEVIRKSLDFIRDTSDDWIGMFSSYSMWWINSHYELYMHSGDFGYLNENREFIIYTLKRCIDELYDGCSVCTFVDWSSHETPWEKSGFFAHLARTMDIGAILCELFGDKMLAEQCRRKAADIRRYKFDFTGNKQMAALGYLGGVCPKETAADIIVTDGAEGLSTFMGYYVLCALGEMGRTKDAIRLAEEYWGGMLKMGATTFWEDFDMAQIKNATRIDEIPQCGKTDLHADTGRLCFTGLRRSLCHAWAGGPAAFYAKYVLGIKIAGPGCCAVKIEPCLGDLTFAEGTFPTPYGDIFVHHEKKDGKINSQADIPKEIKIIR